MSRIDLILFGASGFTGKHTIPFIHKFAKECNLTWGVSGRSESKLKDALQEMSTRTGEDYGNAPIVIADVNDEESLKRLAERARCVINCCGPYRFFGEQVVKACIEAGTHHVDVSGEPQYMEKMQLKYNQLAKEKKVYIVSACGFDSIPADLGIIFLRNNFGGTLNSVETYLTIKEVGEKVPGASVNTGTWESAIYGLAHANELRGLRAQLFPQRLPTLQPKLPKKSVVHKNEQGKLSIPFMGSDRSVAMRTQYYMHEVEKERPVQIQTYMTVASYLHLFVLTLFATVFWVFTRFSFGQQLLLKYPSFFSGGMFSSEGPSQEKQENTVWSITMYGKGWSKKLEDPLQNVSEPMDKEVVAQVSGRNPGYGNTCAALALTAIMILTETSKLPKEGGVYPPGAAFAKTSIVDKLNANGLKYEILESKTLTS